MHGNDIKYLLSYDCLYGLTLWCSCRNTNSSDVGWVWHENGFADHQLLKQTQLPLKAASDQPIMLPKQQNKHQAQQQQQPKNNWVVTSS